MARTDYRKLEAAIHYICDKAKQMGVELDPIKLNKVLWYSDAYAYLARGASITGTRYIRKPFGPVAKYNRIALENLEREGSIAPGKKATDLKWETRLDVLAPADTSMFGADELGTMDRMLDYVGKRLTSAAVSKKTHGAIWSVALDGEEIPLYAVFAEGACKPSTAMMKAAAEGVF